MVDTIQIEGNGSLKVKCAPCDNNITQLRAINFPICDECLKVLREIIKEKKNEQRL